jgi:hypothetical protein
MKLMKTTLFFGGLLALATSVHAEAALVNITVPFSFVAGGKSMPAGNYTIDQPTSGGVLMIRGNQPDSSALVLAINAGPTTADHAGVTFTRHGGAVVMQTIEVPGGASYNLVAPEHRTSAAVRVALPRK